MNQYQKYNKAPFVIYADLECLIEKIDWCKLNPQKSYATISSFNSIENKHGVYGGKDSMKKFYECLRDHAMEQWG